jgi:acyl-CoA thioesterase FadM
MTDLSLPSSNGNAWGATLRVRIGEHDVHYAGGLVDGARMLQLFGDVATELLIRLDGDEGLFRAYESVEFLAPVRAGDYIEARGRVIRLGKTSRTMEFEAVKYIQPLVSEGGTGSVAVSAATVLDPPVLVCRAKGTCVTPLELQRK